MCLAIGVIPAASEPKIVAPAPIVLYMQFEVTPPQEVLEAFQSETETIMEPIGIRLEWRALNATRAEEVATELAVVTVKGRCDLAGMGLRSKIEGALGFTHMSDGQILPFAELSCDKLRNFVQGELLTLSADEREPAFGRALGRVLAHELYHIFANTTKHGSGISKESYTVHDLMCDDFQFQHKEALVLRAGHDAATTGIL